MTGHASEKVDLTQQLVDEAIYLLTHVPWGPMKSWSRDGNTKAADALQEWDERRNDVVRRLLRVGDFGRHLQEGE